MKNILKIQILLTFATIFLASCTDIEVISHRGEPGKDGVSAYHTWLKLYNEGKYPNWKGGSGEADFILFLTGERGKSGKEAYEDWKEMIADGSVNNPHKEGEKWDRNKNTLQDFFLFLTGAKGDQGDQGANGINGENGANGSNGTDGKNGKSAYELWVEVAKTGELPNPKPDAKGYEGEKWPKEKISEEDFRFYLKGKDA